MIYTDAQGRPFDKPEPPPLNAPFADKLAYIRAKHAYNDRITDAANEAFDKAFRRALKWTTS